MDKWTAGTQLGRYELIAALGRGGMGEVWEAELQGPMGFRKRVALKLLKAGPQDDNARAALLSEARLGAMLSHPNVVSTLELGEEGGRWYVAMELVRGVPLALLGKQGPLPAPALLEVGIGTCGALNHIHGLSVDGVPAGLVHRDIKPRNLLVDRTGLLKVADLGIAKLQGSTAEILGTPGYMAPEALRGRAGPRSDLFSLGVVLLTLSSGSNALGKGEGAISATLRIDELLRDGTVLEPLDQAVAGLAAVVRRALWADPARRWSDAAEMASALRALRAQVGPEPGLATLVGRLVDGHDGHSGPTPSSRSAGTEDATLVLGKGEGLPAARDRYFGRRADRKQLTKLLREGTRLVTLIGPGGMGKTRLSLEVARRRAGSLPGGALFCDLESATHADAAAAIVAASLGVVPQGVDVATRVGRALAARGPTLLILDNLEQLVDAVGPLVARWLDAAPSLAILGTSRTPLRVRGERTLVLDPLDTEVGVALFQDRAAAELEGAELEAVATLVDALDGLPLAIELAAARTRLLPPSAILSRLQDRFRLLTGGGPDRPARHQTLRASIDGSWELLEDFEQAALAQLSVFDGPISLEAAEAVLDLSKWPQAGWSLDVLASLVDHSLLRLDDHRFRVLSSVRQYGSEVLSADARRVAEVRHGVWFAQLGTPEALEALTQRGGVARLHEVVEAIPNLTVACRRAVARGDGAVAHATALVAAHGTDLVGPVSLAAELLEHASTVPGPRHDEVQVAFATGVARTERSDRASQILAEVGARARATGDLATMGAVDMVLAASAWRDVRVDEAEALVRSALDCLQRAGERAQATRARSTLALILAGTGQSDEALQEYDLVLERLKAQGHHALRARVMGNRANLLLDVGRTEEARADLENAIQLHIRVGATRSEAVARGNLAQALIQLGRNQEARQHLEASLEGYRIVGEPDGAGFIHNTLGMMVSREGDSDGASEHFELALAAHREFGNRRSEGVVLGNLGSMQLSLGAYDLAIQNYEQSIAIHRETGHRRSEGIALGNLAVALIQKDRLPEARRRAMEALEIHREVRNPRSEGIALTELARAEDRLGDPHAARTHVRHAIPLLASVGDPLPEGRALLLHAELLRKAGDAQGADGELVRAASRFQAAQSTVERAMAVAMRAELLATDDPAAAAALKDEAEQLLDDENATVTAHELRAMLARVAARLTPG